MSDRAAEPPLAPTDMLTLAADAFTCAPPGSGKRAGIDRDGKLDRDELDSGGDPADPAR